MGLYAYQRTSDVRYTKRPPANRKAARWAWDRLSRKGAVRVLWLGQGYWIAGYDNNEYDEIDATIVRHNTVKGGLRNA